MHARGAHSVSLTVTLTSPERDRVRAAIKRLGILQSEGLRAGVLAWLESVEADLPPVET